MPAAAPFREQNHRPRKKAPPPWPPACKQTAAPFLPAEERGRLQNSEDPLQERYIPSKILHSTFRMRSFDSLRSLRMTGARRTPAFVTLSGAASGNVSRAVEWVSFLVPSKILHSTFYILHSTFYIGGQARYSETSSPRTRSALFSSSRRNRGRGCSRRRRRSVKRAE